MRDADLAYIFELQSDAASVELAGVKSRDQATFDAHWATIRSDPDTTLRMVLDDGVAVGTAMSFERDGYREVGYWIDRSHWGKGIASVALGLLVAELPRPLSGVLSASNQGSRRVLEKHNFQLRDQWTDDDGVEVLRMILD